MKSCILRGVPSSLKQDGWWLDPITRVAPSPDQPHAAQNPIRYSLHALLLAGLIGLTQMPGVPDGSSRALAPVPVACSIENDLGFHAARDFRSLEAAQQQGTPI